MTTTTKKVLSFLGCLSIYINNTHFHRTHTSDINYVIVSQDKKKGRKKKHRQTKTRKRQLYVCTILHDRKKIRFLEEMNQYLEFLVLQDSQE